jgi:nicotinamide-nucleotide amidase
MPTPDRPVLDSATQPRPLRTAVLLAVGSELTTGETRDTNGGELARSLAVHGVEVLRIVALPDRLIRVQKAVAAALAEADLVVTTGGLGPTPDDLTREAIATVVGERPEIDPELERWLRHLFERRNLPYLETNRKQAWLIPSATSIPNDRGTAPGWWIDRPDGRVVVTLPGPPSEMRGMWQSQVLPRLQARGLGREQVVLTYRLAGIGESAVATRLGEGLLRAANPVVATYARADAVDVRISAHAEGARTAAELAAEAETAVIAAVGDYVWGREDDTWPDVLSRELGARELTVALLEAGTAGATMRLLGEAPFVASARAVPATDAAGPIGDLAERTRLESGAPVGLAVRATESGEDMWVEVGVAGSWGIRTTRQTAFLGGPEGHRRAALAGVAFLLSVLRRPERHPESVEPGGSPESSRKARR